MGISIKHTTLTAWLGIAAVAAMASPARAQTVVNADRAVFGSSTFGDVLRVVGAGPISGATGTMNPWVLDSDGDALRDPNVTVTSAGLWTFGTLNLNVGNGLGTGQLNLNGLAGSSKGFRFLNSGTLAGQISVTDTVTHFDLPGSLLIRNGAGSTERADLTSTGDLTTRGHIKALGTSPVSTAAVGQNNTRIGVNNNAPRVILETVGSPQWELDNVNGLFRLVRMDNAGVVDNRPLQIDGNININPYGKFVLPVEPYSISFGSPQRKFAAAWFADLFVDTLIANENIGTTGGRWLVGTTNIFDHDVSAGATQITVRYNNFSLNDFVYAEKSGRTEFFKINSVATLTNLEPNPSFETNNTTGWAPAAGATVTNVTTKSFRGNRAMLVDVAPGGSIVQNTGVSLTAGQDYALCAYVRRTDGGVIALGDVQAWLRDGYTNLTTEATGTDGWYRMCRTGLATSTGPSFPNPHFLFANGAVDYYLDAVQVEAFGAVRTYSDTRAVYNVLRDQDGGGANDWFAGDAVFNTGATSGFGWIDCYAIRGMKSSAEAGPSCVANVRNGSSYNSWEPFAGWGNLNGLWHYSSNTFGFAAGPQSGPHITVDNTVGIRFWQGATEKARFDLPSGNIQLGDFVLNRPVLLATPSSLQFCIYGGPCKLQFDGTSGNITTTGNIYLSAGGNIESTGEWSLTRNGGLKIERNSGPIGSTGAQALTVGTGGAIDFRLASLSNGAFVHLWKNTGDLIIGDQAPGVYTGSPSNVILYNDGTSASPGDIRATTLTVGTDGVVFDFVKHLGAAASNVDRIRPAQDAMMSLGSPSQRWKNIHLSLPFNGSPTYFVVNNSNVDSTSLGFINAGTTVTKMVGSCQFVIQAGLITAINLC